VLANKCEAEDRASLQELRDGLDLDDIHTTRFFFFFFFIITLEPRVE